ncbi:hypothetical protein M3P05_04335 [Sansalvadorimonas sp. 2012CJ34-2]|uniref:Uncharacterized protein n=1 Tax=Parendozoicomonas callyspongiae TaxID=2942213 RepID=A0ABT0PDR5_9GAMM|nr:hypothetical protein [Sansalvadorimonas sp. 2012CJ34-2]MCL6269171.1 hypothetical protein [Sansalvadorimonas sp. 2012CJ34-2]
MRLFKLSLQLLGTLSLAIASLGVVQAEMLSLEQDGASQITSRVINKSAVYSSVEGADAPVLFSYQGRNGEKVVSIGERLPLKVRKDGVDMGMAQHKTQIDGNEAIALIDGSSLHLSYREQVGENSERIHATLEGNQARESIWQSEVEKGDKPLDIDLELQTPEELRETEQDINTAYSGNQPVTIYVFVHNDVKESDKKLTKELFTWWVGQMNKVNERHMSKGNPSLFSEVIVDFRSDNRIQSFNYKGTPADKLKELAVEFRRYKQGNGIVGSYRRNKFLLVTEQMMNWQTLGVAYVGGQYGMAADDDDQVAAHEIGHMFSGLHENADIWYTGWWCETVLYWQHLPFRASCHKYTKKNMDAIADYLD